LGVVGVGNVGSRVVNTADMLGMRVYLCGPPRVRAEGACGFISHDGIIRECDIITYHVPLLTSGPDKTYHTIDQKMLDKVNPGTIIINTSRGEVADTVSLKNALRSGKIAGAVLDVWEHEPDIDLELMNLCTQATPHIAGYSTDGKAKGTSMIIRELSCYFHLDMEDWEPNDIPQPKNPEIQIDCSLLSEEEVIEKVITATYNVMEDDLRLRQHPENFEKQRGDYPLRREFKAYTLTLDNGSKDTKRICRKLGFKVL
jgi:erythronate-4-phosphate dehydrogenase